AATRAPPPMRTSGRKSCVTSSPGDDCRNSTPRGARVVNQAPVNAPGVFYCSLSEFDPKREICHAEKPPRTADTCGEGSNRAAVRSRAELSLVPDARTNGRGELHIREPRAMHAVDRRQHGALLRESGLHVSSCVCAQTTATERLAASSPAAC